MTQEKDIVLHSKVMDKVVDIISNNGLEIKIVKISFPKPCHSRIVYSATTEGLNTLIKTIKEINDAEMEYLKTEALASLGFKELRNRLSLKTLKAEQEKLNKQTAY